MLRVRLGFVSGTFQVCLGLFGVVWEWSRVYQGILQVFALGGCLTYMFSWKLFGICTRGFQSLPGLPLPYVQSLFMGFFHSMFRLCFGCVYLFSGTFMYVQGLSMLFLLRVCLIRFVEAGVRSWWSMCSAALSCKFFHKSFLWHVHVRFDPASSHTTRSWLLVRGIFLYIFAQTARKKCSCEMSKCISPAQARTNCARARGARQFSCKCSCNCSCDMSERISSAQARTNCVSRSWGAALVGQMLT